MPLTVLMVAEKPSIANSIAKILAGGGGPPPTRKGIATPVHEFSARFLHHGTARYKVTSVTGHVLSTDFPPEFQSWEKTPPESLFHAPVRKEPSNPKGTVCKHLTKEAKGCDLLVLWLDCDREGENICFEVMEFTVRHMNKRSGQQVFRAKFSAVSAPDIERAMRTLTEPNRDESLSVDARQELDLKVGVAFTRFQTRYFQGKYGNLDAHIISYGPCQTPTLGFVVSRHDRIVKFEPEPFWSIAPEVHRGGQRVRLEWERGRVFDQSVAHMLLQGIAHETTAKVLRVKVDKVKRTRPLPLNTVALLKLCSKSLGMGPHHAMQIAERLYIAGYVSYPRTESTRYPTHQDTNGILRQHQRHSVWGDYVRSLLETGVNRARPGVDVGDHPPITPMRCANPSDLSGDQWRVYDMISRHFIATVSPDAVFERTAVTFAIGAEKFSVTGRRMLSPGFTLVMSWRGLTARDPDEEGGEDGDDEEEERGLPDFAEGERVPIGDLSLSQGKTSPPKYLTESELITLMEKHGIGTDASIPTHINNICERNYAAVQGGRREMVPTPLGIVLVHGYLRIDPDLVLPAVRSHIERQISLIAEGKASYQEVVDHAIEVFLAKFKYLVRKIEKMDILFESTFSPLASTGKPLSRCGICHRYMRYISLRPQRLHCTTCDETYSLPSNGTIKLYKELTCPLDGFELVLSSVGPKEKAFPLCPYCYNNPPYPGTAKGMQCTLCTHPTCTHSMLQTAVCACSECDTGLLCLELNSEPNWKLSCNVCNFLVNLPDAVHKVKLSAVHCTECDSPKMDITFHHTKTPLPDGAQEYSGCLLCDDMLHSMCEWRLGRMVHRRFTRRRGGKKGRRGGRGRGRGRGRRGGRGRR